jgi:hypothetical protein
MPKESGTYRYLSTGEGKERRRSRLEANHHEFPRDGSHFEGEHPQVTRRHRLGPEGCAEEVAMKCCARRYAGHCRHHISDDVVPRKVWASKKPTQYGERCRVWLVDCTAVVGQVVWSKKFRSHHFVHFAIGRNKAELAEGRTGYAPQWAVFPY